jgi:hypothetical protein
LSVSGDGHKTVEHRIVYTFSHACFGVG